MADLKDLKARSSDLLRQMPNGALYRRAYEKGMTLSRFLEEQDPSHEYPEAERGLDAFDRLMAAAGIVANSDPEGGYYADRFEEFDKNDATRALVPEWVSRQWRKVQNPGRGNRANPFTSADYALGSVFDPYVDAAGIRGNQIAPAIPLSELIGATTAIDNDAYRAVYLTDADTPAADMRMVRVAEGAEIPRMKLSGGEHTIRLHKYGRALETTYELLRRQRIDMVALYIQRMAVQAEKDKVAAVMDVIINGDGNSGTAATEYNLLTLDPDATAGVLSLKGWLSFKMQFANPYYATTVLAREDTMLQAMLLNTGSGNVPLASFPFAFNIQPINPGLADGLRAGWTSDAPANKFVAFDRRFAIERVTEIGADISEVERWATRQVQILTMTEVEGYAVMDAGASKILDISE